MWGIPLIAQSRKGAGVPATPRRKGEWRRLVDGRVSMLGAFGAPDLVDMDGFINACCGESDHQLKEWNCEAILFAALRRWYTGALAALRVEWDATAPRTTDVSVTDVYRNSRFLYTCRLSCIDIAHP